MALENVVKHELKQWRFLTGFSQEEAAHHLGISRTTVQTIESGKPVRRFIAEMVRAALTERSRPDWPEAITNLREEYKACERLPRTQFRRYLANLEHLLEGQRALHEDSIHAAGYLWLLAWIAQDRVAVFKEDQVLLQLALSRYERATSILSSLVKASGDERYAFLLAKAKLAQFTCFFSGKEEFARVSDPEVRDWILENDLLGVCHACAAREPWDWSALRNGLVVASIMRSERDCNVFFQSLVNANVKFADLGFIPQKGVLPLSKNTDLKFFLQLKQDQAPIVQGDSSCSTQPTQIS